MSVRAETWALVAPAVVTCIYLDAPWARRWLGGVWTPAAMVACAAWRGPTGDWARSKAVIVKTVACIGSSEACLAKDVVVILAAGCVLRVARSLRRRARDWRALKSAAAEFGIEAAKLVPWVRGKIEAELDKARLDLRASLRPNKTSTVVAELDEEGASIKEVTATLRDSSAAENKKWQQGLVSGAVYHGEASHLALTSAAFDAYSVANPLHSDIWPSVNKMEAEVVGWVARLLDGGDRNVVGAMTSGGTESIVLAVKAHRDKWRHDMTLRNSLLSKAQTGEIVCCETAHAAVDKAGDILGLRVVKVPCLGSSYRVDVAAMRRAISSDTVLLYASAPSFPQGCVDDIRAVAELASRHNVGCHVDCCLGGLVLPFLENNVPAFDFALPGVTSMSVDTHKYGYSPKGTSVVLYRDSDYRKYMYFCYPAWTGGLYVTPTIAGSRSGAVIAATWASLKALGKKGLRDNARAVARVATSLARRVDADVPALRILGATRDPSTKLLAVDAMIVCFAAADPSKLDVYVVNDLMTHKGWSLNGLQRPPCVHLCCTVQTLPRHVQDRFIADLQDAVARALEKGGPGPAGSGDGSAAIYGVASSMPAGPVSEILRCYTDIQLEP